MILTSIIPKNNASNSQSYSLNGFCFPFIRLTENSSKNLKLISPLLMFHITATNYNLK